MRARPSTEMHSTVSSTVNTTCGFACMLRAFREVGAHENANDDESGSHTPQTGNAWGRPFADAVTTQ